MKNFKKILRNLINKQIKPKIMANSWFDLWENNESFWNGGLNAAVWNKVQQMRRHDAGGIAVEVWCKILFCDSECGNTDYPVSSYRMWYSCTSKCLDPHEINHEFRNKLLESDLSFVFARRSV